MKGYKAFNSDLSCRSYKYEVGKEYVHEGEIELCGAGFHFCPQAQHIFSYYSFLKDSTRVCEVEATGKVIEGHDKCVTDKIKIIRELSWDEVLKIVNTGLENTGLGNSGYYNSGDYNSGNYNSGDYNSGDYNSGFFNTDEPTVRLFNKDTGKKRGEIDIPYISLPITEWISESNMTEQQKEDNPNFKTQGGFLLKRSYKEAWIVAWDRMDSSTRQRFLDLPNFDAKIFEEITGVDVTQGREDD